MIGCLPRLRPDEPLYSVLARRADALRDRDGRTTAREVFGSGTVTAVNDLPSHLDAFIAGLPPDYGLSADDVIDGHTLLPWYAASLPPDRVARLRADMRGAGRGIHARAGVMAGGVALPQRIRFCPTHVAEDRRDGGECFWHRVHQVPGVLVCPEHGVFLEDSDVPARHRTNRHPYASAERSARPAPPHHIDPGRPSHSILARIAVDAAHLLSRPATGVEPGALRDRYVSALQERGLATVGGRVRAAAFVAEFQAYYPPALLSALRCHIDPGIGDNWLLRLVRAPGGAQHTLRHLLLIHFLGHSVASFSILPETTTLFGSGPYPCLNRAGGHYGEDTIAACDVRRGERGHPVGVFACPSCEFTYLRSGPARAPEDRFHVGRIVAFGPVWEEALRATCGNAMLSMEERGRVLGVDPVTVKRHAARLGLIDVPQTTTSRHVTMPVDADGGAAGPIHRAVWERATSDYPTEGVRQLRERFPATYAWLYRHDRSRLTRNKPARRRPPPRVDWDRRDADLSDATRRAARHLYNATGRPVQVTATSIGRLSGHLAVIRRHTAKLPRTAAMLAELAEARDTYAARRLWWMALGNRRAGVRATYWDLVERAGIARVRAVPEVSAILRMVLSATDRRPIERSSRAALGSLLRHYRACRGRSPAPV